MSKVITRDREGDTMTSAPAAAITQLRSEFEGRSIVPDDADYDKARTVVAGHVDRRPAVIVRPADASEVARVVRFARESGMPLAVRCGGHSGAGHSVVDDGIVLRSEEHTSELQS